MNFRLVEVIDKEEGTLDDDMEATNFLQKFVGGKFGYHIFLEQKKDKVQITEIGMIETKHFFAKIFFKIIGLFYKIKDKKIYQQIKKEIKAIN